MNAASHKRNYVPRPRVRTDLSEKCCSDCKETKSIGQFYRTGKNSSRYQSYCKPCFNARQRKWYESNRDRVNQRVAQNSRLKVLASGGRDSEPTHCEACSAAAISARNGRFSNDKGKAPKTKGLAYDHDHHTGEFRGWLCANCNRALGLMDDDPELILKLALYLERHRSKSANVPEAPSLRVVSENSPIETRWD
jgi:hypothetical protein